MKRFANLLPLLLASAAYAGVQPIIHLTPIPTPIGMYSIGDASDANVPLMSDMTPTTAPDEKESGVVSVPLTPEVKAVLQALQDRKATLKDFTAKVDYEVENKAGDLDGKKGTINYTDDGTTTKFAFDFTRDTFNGKPTHMHHNQLISDGTCITIIDDEAKQFQRIPSPGPTNSLKSPIPIPIGIKIDEITNNFNVVMQPAGKDPNLVTLRLTPLLKGRFDYIQLDLTVDKTLNIPVKIVATAAKNGQITTVKFLDPALNTGKAIIPAVTIPGPSTGWTVDLGQSATAPAPPATMPAK